MKILCVESRDYYSSIIDDYTFENSDIEFEGHRYYKESGNFFLRYDAILSIQYLWPVCNLIIFKANSVGVNTFLLTDGIVEWNNCFNHSEVLKCKNRLFSSIFHVHFLCPGAFESSFIHESSCSYTPKKIIPVGYTTKMRPNSKKRILLTTANSAYFDNEEMHRLIDIMKNIASESIKNENVELIIRVFDEHILDALADFDFFNDIKTPFNDLLVNVDAVISTPSSIILTSMLSKKPTCQIIYRDSPLLLQSGWMIHGSTNVQITLNDISESNMERMQYQNFVVENNYKNSSLIDLVEFKSNSKFGSSNAIIDKELLRMLESPWNLNVEFFVRKTNKNLKLFIKSLILVFNGKR